WGKERSCSERMLTGRGGRPSSQRPMVSDMGCLAWVECTMQGMLPNHRAATLRFIVLHRALPRTFWCAEPVAPTGAGFAIQEFAEDLGQVLFEKDVLPTGEAPDRSLQGCCADEFPAGPDDREKELKDGGVVDAVGDAVEGDGVTINVDDESSAQRFDLGRIAG